MSIEVSRAGFHTRRLVSLPAMGSRPILTASFIVFTLLAACALLGASPALATGIIPTDPITNEVGVDPDADIVATCTGAINPTTVTTGTFVAQGMMSGRRDGAFSFSGGDTVVTLNPDADYFPGEVVRVSATAGVSDTGGSPVDAYQWQFTAGPVFDRCAAGFTDIDAGLTGVAGSSVDWGDYDGDGDLDILLTGHSAGPTISQVWRNNGDGTFTDIAASLPGIIYGSADWGDYDNDGDLDILLVGNSVGSVYRNEGAGSFVPAALLTPMSRAGADWGDYDNDGDLDVVLVGWRNGSDLAQVWRNDGGDVFTNINAALTGVSLGSADWGDYDNDGDLDILLTGDNDTTPPYKFAYVYRNDGGGTFIVGYELGFAGIGVSYSSGAWGDYDNDGYLDILFIGADDWYPGSRLALVYHNNHDGAFSDIGAGLTGVQEGSVDWGDYDNDGDLDVLLTGNTNDNSSPRNLISRVYRNDGPGGFALAHSLPGVFQSSAAWGDFDNDGDLDVLLTGADASFNGVAKVYRNDDCPNLIKRVSPALKADYHGVVTYTLVLSNTRGATTTVSLTDTLPAKVDFAGWLGDDHGATAADDEILWAGVIDAGQIVTWTWTVTQTGSYDEVVNNTAWYDYGTGTGSAAAAFAVKGPPVLDLSKEAAPASGVDYHGVATYSVMLANLGESGADEALLTDTLPAAVEFADWVEQNGAVRSGNTITWTGSVDAGAVLTWVWTVTHTGSYAEVVTNTVEAAHPGTGQTVEVAAAFAVKGPPALELSKEAAPASGVDYHGVATYSVMLANLGESGADEALLTDTLPAAVEFADWVEQNGAVRSGNTITWTGSVDAGAELTWVWTVTHTGSYAEVVTNTVEAAHPGTGQAVEGEAAFTVKDAPSLTITKSVAPASGVAMGDVVTYTVMLENIGESPAIGAAMTDTLPARVGFAGWVEQNGATEAGGAITWAGDVGAGAALTWTWQVTFTGGLGAVDNTAWYSHTVAGAGSATATFTSVELYYLPVIYKK